MDDDIQRSGFSYMAPHIEDSPHHSKVSESTIVDYVFYLTYTSGGGGINHQMTTSFTCMIATLQNSVA